ncbi:hypothetical protein PPROV_000700600 [Pycnococcus provasolii]|uniref:Protein disulfide-isomerase n=1 Tax=Pycnococcus provasolii TaxID=41880 RepID=A0A830HNM0_9CHLO|nr:hypothetical protein PPROV_000700600 [Pycnococcus provasolii]|mmetsp:Transcript_6279/g.14294  ORF Transcript_6279/g.14294 Transcript_6279/m.14294 type:complete len:483 (-) Transcript_6279:231-1679(-)
MTISSMSKYALFALVALSAFSAVASAEDVVTLTGKNFDEWTSAQDFAVVEFYAPWCGHCKKLTPEYEKAAGILKKENPPILLAKVDATEEENKELGTKFGIRGFPTLKIFRKGAAPEDYNGPREADGIVDYVKKMSGPAASLLTTKKEVDAFLAENDAALLGVFSGEKDEALATFLTTANVFREDGGFAYVFDEKVLPTKGTKAGAKAHLYKKYDNEYDAFEGSIESEALKEFFNEKSTPLVVTFDQDPKNRARMNKVFSSEKPKMLAFVDFASKEDEMRRVLTEQAPKYKEHVNILIADFKDNDRAMEFFGLSKDSKKATVVIHSMADNKKYVQEVEGDFSKVATFMQGFADGKLEAHVKSEPIPDKNNDPVYVLVAKEFEKVMGSGKDVMVEFYAPWCGHCKKLAPIYDEVGTEFKSNDKVVVANFDATANDVPDAAFNVKGFPTLYFKNGKTGEISQYEGAREKDALIKYIKEKGAFAA